MDCITYTAKRGNFDIAELLIKEGAIINIENDEWDTPLHVACKKKKRNFYSSYIKQIL